MVFRHAAALLAALYLALFSARALDAQPAARMHHVVFSEIQYHPHSDDPRDEFIELENRGDREVDLSGWVFVEGIAFVIPNGTRLAAGATLVVSPDRDHTIARYGLPASRVVGDWIGRLDDGGEIVHLVDARGESAFRAHYRDSASWPDRADGDGPSLELTTTYWDPYASDSWRSSAEATGSPGEPTLPARAGSESRDLLRDGGAWRYFEGVAEPTPGDPLEWTDLDFDDANWPSGEAPFGYGDVAFRTQLDDMWGEYVSLYGRAQIDLAGDELERVLGGASGVTVRVAYDDGFVLYVNGAEVTRANAPGDVGDPVPFDAGASKARNSSRTVVLSGADAPFVEGRNVFAVHGLNQNTFSGDFLIGVTARLTSSSSLDETARPRVNEIRSGVDGFVELFNASASALDLEGYSFTDDPHRDRQFVFGRVSIGPRGFVTVAAGDLGFPLADGRSTYLLLDDAGTVVDTFRTIASNSNRSTARVPDGGGNRESTATPTPGASNEHAAESRVIVNEIHYHPNATPSSPLEFIELVNRSNETVDLSSWRLASAVRFTFPNGASLEPGEFAVVTGDVDAFRTHYGDLESLVGPWEGSLQNDEEEVELKDVHGNVVDRVHYADDGAWPGAPDGSGPSLELIHSSLDNRFGSAWTPGPADGTPGAANGSFDEMPRPVIGRVRHEPTVPGPGDEVTISCRVSAARPVTRVVLHWENDSGDESDLIALLDQGENGDAHAGDGIYSGRIPPLPDEAVVRFRLEAEDGVSRREEPGDSRWFLYQVSSSPFVHSEVPHYSILMTRRNWSEIRNRGRGSDVLLDATFVDHGNDRAYYNVGVRFRGNGSRNPPDDRQSYRVRFSDDRKFQGVERINLNAQNPHRQFIGNSIFRRWGIPYPMSLPAAVRLDRGVDARYVRVEAYDEEFLNRYFGGDDDGNLYRGLSGRLQFRGDDPDPYRNRYRKVTNEDENDYTDLIELTRLFTLDEADFHRELAARVDIFEWIRYFAAQGALGNNENSINIDAGDDYYLYCRRSDDRFVIIPWDTDSVFVDEEQNLFRPSADALVRFLRHPDYAPLFFCAIEDFRRGLMSETSVSRDLDRVTGVYRPDEISSIESFVPERQAFLDPRIPVDIVLEDNPGGGELLIAPGDEWRYWPGRDEPSGGDLEWTLLDFDDGAWDRGPSGFGYGDDDDATVIDDMQDSYGTVFIRRQFAIDDPASVRALALLIDYDDGFVAYLNGVEIARSNFNGPFPRAGDTASQDREAGDFERHAVEGFADLLDRGENILAIVGLNGTLDSSDLSLIPSLEVEFDSPDGACEDVLTTNRAIALLRGTAPACATATVEVNGERADYTPWQASWTHDVPLEPGVQSVSIRALDSSGREVAAKTISVERNAAATEIPRTVDGSLVLRSNDSPFRLSDTTTVPEGSSLTIGAGVTVVVEPGARLVVDGSIVARGEAEFPVSFRPASCSGAWTGIEIRGAGAHSFERVRFESGAEDSSIVTVRTGDVTFTDCVFAEFAGEGAARRGRVPHHGWMRCVRRSHRCRRGTRRHVGRTIDVPGRDLGGSSRRRRLADRGAHRRRSIGRSDPRVS